MQRQIIIAPKAGFCFGVKRAVDMVEKKLEEQRVAEKHRLVYCLGSLIHNDQVVKKLEEKGLQTVSQWEEIPSGSVFIIRSHGVPPQIVEQVKAKGIEILDATCPFVKKAQLAAKEMKEQGCQVVICGDSDHAEVIGINAHLENQGTIIAQAEEVFQQKFGSSTVGIVCQTTQKIELLKKTVSALLEQGVKNLVIKNTICQDSTAKQQEVSQLARQVDLMIVVGGKSSSNTTKLAELSKKAGTVTYHIETAAEVDPAWLRKAQKIGIAAGASTAQFLIDEVASAVAV